MRYDILKLQFSHTLSMRGATVTPLSNYTNHGIQGVVSMVIPYDLYTLSIYNLERLLLTFTPTNYVILRYMYF